MTKTRIPHSVTKQKTKYKQTTNCCKLEKYVIFAIFVSCGNKINTQVQNHQPNLCVSTGSIIMICRQQVSLPCTCIQSVQFTFICPLRFCLDSNKIMFMSIWQQFLKLFYLTVTVLLVYLQKGSVRSDVQHASLQYIYVSFCTIL